MTRFGVRAGISLLSDEDLAARSARVLSLARGCGVRLVVCESMTGGLLSGLLTEPSGASDVFSFGLVVYSDLAKSELLGVPRALLSAKGAVSAEVASSMLSGLLARASSGLSSDGSRVLGLALTGYAGSYSGDEVSTSEPLPPPPSPPLPPPPSPPPSPPSSPPKIAPKASPKKLARDEEEETGLLYLAAGFSGYPANEEQHQQEHRLGLHNRHTLRRMATAKSLRLLAQLLEITCDY